ncbi:MAG: methionine gamma-lyase family protein, partial [Candidatus Avispirillum sp.]
MQISQETRKAAAAAEEALAPVFARIDEVSRICSERVIDVFKDNRVSESMFAQSTGYGYGDRGRDAVDKICAEIFGAPAGFMRPSILCGTHAITVGLFGLLRPGDVMLSVTGTPYDTLHSVIGIGKSGADGSGSLKDFGVEYAEIPMTPDGNIDNEAMKAALRHYGDRVKVVYLQRSKGYADRKTLSVGEICAATELARETAGHDIFVVLDNCYGEFTETEEPCNARFGKGAV